MCKYLLSCFMENNSQDEIDVLLKYRQSGIFNKIVIFCINLPKIALNSNEELIQVTDNLFKYSLIFEKSIYQEPFEKSIYQEPFEKLMVVDLYNKNRVVHNIKLFEDYIKLNIEENLFITHLSGNLLDDPDQDDLQNWHRIASGCPIIIDGNNKISMSFTDIINDIINIEVPTIKEKLFLDRLVKYIDDKPFYFRIIPYAYRTPFYYWLENCNPTNNEKNKLASILVQRNIKNIPIENVLNYYNMFKRHELYQKIEDNLPTILLLIKDQNVIDAINRHIKYYKYDPDYIHYK